MWRGGVLFEEEKRIYFSHFSSSPFQPNVPHPEIHNSVFTPAGVLKPDTSLSLRVRTVLQKEEGYVFWHGGPGF